MLALQVESSHRELGPKLHQCALQFARIEDQIAALGLSPVLVRATIEQGLRAGAGVDFTAVLDRGRLVRNVFCRWHLVLLSGAAVGLSRGRLDLVQPQHPARRRPLAAGHALAVRAADYRRTKTATITSRCRAATI